MYYFLCYMMSSGPDGWIIKGNRNYTNKNKVCNDHGKNKKYQDAVRGCKSVLFKISIIADSLIEPKAVGKRELKKRDQRQYTYK